MVQRSKEYLNAHLKSHTKNTIYTINTIKSKALKKGHLKPKVCFSALALLLAVSCLFGSSRDRWQQPFKVLKVVGVKPGMVIGEPGAGRGYYTFKLAKIVGNDGKVYANDIYQYLLDDIKEKSKKKNLPNVITIKGKEKDPLFPVKSMDMLFMSYVIHDMKYPVAFMKNARKCLKPDAPVVLLEQDPDKWPDGRGHFFEKKVLMDTMDKAGYRLEKIETFLERDNIYIYKAKQYDQ